jgi:hypothetical protein
MNGRRWLAVIGLILSAGLLAFPLRPVVHQLVVIPLAFLLWGLGLLYLALPQVLWWTGVVLIVLFILGKSILPDIKFIRKPAPILRQERGGVESLAAALQKSNKGIYFKWLVANRLGRLAQQMLAQRGHGKPRSPFEPLADEGWESTPEVQAYLEKGLHGSFAEFPNSRWKYFAPPVKTSLDHDIGEVVEFLESNLEGMNSTRSRRDTEIQ